LLSRSYIQKKVFRESLRLLGIAIDLVDKLPENEANKMESAILKRDLI